MKKTRGMITEKEKAHIIKVGRMLMHKRIEKKMSQAELGKKMNLSHQQIAKYENGKNQMPLSVVIRMVKALDIEDYSVIFNEVTIDGEVCKT
jgi:transcriptional regulator with XRE-family HTH domain